MWAQLGWPWYEIHENCWSLSLFNCTRCWWSPYLWMGSGFCTVRAGLGSGQLPKISVIPSSSFFLSFFSFYGIKFQQSIWVDTKPTETLWIWLGMRKWDGNEMSIFISFPILMIGKTWEWEWPFQLKWLFSY